MRRKKVFIVLLVLSLVAVLACAPGAEKTELPANFVTYTYPEEFSLSFPNDWELDYRFEAPTTELAKKMAANPTVQPIDLIQTVLYGGLPGGPDYEPVVTVSIVPRFDRFFTLDEIYETDKKMFTEEVPEYRENSVEWTTVDGREATIIDSQDNQSEDGERRYLILTTPAGSLVWYVVCSVAIDDYPEWEDTFEHVVSSLMILQ